MDCKYMLGGEKMKKISFRILCFILALSLFTFIPAFAQEAAKDLDACIWLDSSEAEKFKAEVASDESYIELIELAAWKKGMSKGIEVSAQGVHPDKIIKVYGTEISEDPLKSTIDVYEEEGKIKSIISDNYAYVVFYVDENDEYVSSGLFAKDNKGKWRFMCGGSFLLTDGALAKYSKAGSFKEYIDYASLEGIESFKLVSAIPSFQISVYFEKNGEEFLMPLEDIEEPSEDEENPTKAKKLNIYKAADVVENRLKPVYEYQLAKNTGKYDEMPIAERPAGDPEFPENLPVLTPIDLTSYFANKEIISENLNTANNNKIIPENQNISDNQAVNTPEPAVNGNIKWIVVISAALIFFAAVVLVYRKKLVK